MNNEELFNIYGNKLEICKNGGEGCEDLHEVMINTEDVIEKSFMIICRYFNPDLLMYSMPCLFYRNGQWYKYSIYNPGPIQLNNAVLLTNNEIFKLIKRNLLSMQKKIIMNKFLRPNCVLNLENLNIQKTHLNILKDLTIDSQIYINIKLLLEYLFTFDDENFVV